MKSQHLSDSHVLVVDDDAMFRKVLCAQLEQVGCHVVAADSYDQALELFHRDPRISLVILDHPTVGAGLREMVARLRHIRQTVTIVGNSGLDRREEFAAAGVDKYLDKPWRLPDLVNVLEDGLIRCVECGRRLPLRHPRPGEPAGNWVCVSCGARYRARLHEAAPADLRPYAAPSPEQGLC